MTEYLPFLVAGLTSGAVYGLAGIGLVLTFKTSGVFNFAHGALATVAAYVFFELYVERGSSWQVAALVAVLIAGPVMGTTLELIARRVATAGLALQVGATVGLLLVIESVTTLIYDPIVVRTVPVFISDASFRFAGTNIRWADVVTLSFAIAVTIALAVYFRVSRTGLQMRAVVDGPELLALSGTSPVSTRRLAWILGATLVAASGVLFAPIMPLNPLTLTFLVVAAFGAAALGGFSNLPMTLVGGLAIGVLASLATKWFSTGLLSGVPVSLPFLVLFAVLLLFPKRKLAGQAFTTVRARPTWRAPLPFQALSGLCLLGFLSFVPAFAGIHMTAWTAAVASVVVFLSLSLLVRSSGQVSLAHVSFTAIGAAGFSHLAVDRGVPWLLALVLAGLIAVPVGALLAIPAIRLTGLYLALATFGFGILLQSMFYTQDYMFGDSGLGLPEPRPGWDWVPGEGDTAYYYVVLALVAVITLGIVSLNRSRLGRLMRGVADSPMAVATSGAEVNVTRVIVFCLSAFLAAVGGALAAVAAQQASADSYQPLTSLIFFVLILIVFGGEPWNAVLASFGFYLVPSYFTSHDVAVVLQLVFGLSAVAVAVLPPHLGGVPPAVTRAVDRVFRRGAPRSTVPTTSRAKVLPGELNVRDLVVRFGGLRAVDGVTLSAPTGRVTGLIGPNGAGKTTTFNACSGLVTAAEGTIDVDGQDLTRRSPAFRARRGIGRTFQKMELFESLSVRENVAMGVEASLAGFNPLTHVISRRTASRRVDGQTTEALDLCGLAELAHRPVSALSTGQRRSVELARCLAGNFKILLLDEPSSGLDRQETQRFGEILRSVVDQRGIGILLVEHDMSLVLDTCAYIYVLDFGRLMFEGTPAEVIDSPIVRAAYLGDAAELAEESRTLEVTG
jgi:ABC-type branched-subunit amino acid transport system ATPase component/branched-subunit amino acid ABC-type transport system permease component